MVNRPEHISRLTSAPTEMEAGIIVAALDENGIRATMAGQTVSGFRAEAPGWVQVLVAEEDVPRAQALLAEVRQDRDEIDWSQVDVGEPEHEELPDSGSLLWWTSLTFWRRVAVVLIVLCLICFALGIVRGLLEMLWRI